MRRVRGFLVVAGAVNEHGTTVRTTMIETKLNRYVLGRILNLLLWFITCGLAGTGFLLGFRMPHGSEGGRGLYAGFFDRHVWGEIHLYLGVAFAVMVIAHLLLHIPWMWRVASQRKAWAMAGGLGLGIVLTLLITLQPHTRTGDPDIGRRQASAEMVGSAGGGGGGYGMGGGRGMGAGRNRSTTKQDQPLDDLDILLDP